MAIFTLNINAQMPQYENGLYVNVGETSALCTPGADTNIDIPIMFDSTGLEDGFNTGYNYTGVQPVTLRVMSFSEIQTEVDPSTPLNIITTPVEPGTNGYILNNSIPNAVYPFDVDLLSRVGPSDTISGLTVKILKKSNCPSVSGWNANRQNIITYKIIDSNGTEGPVRTSIYQYNLVENTI